MYDINTYLVIVVKEETGSIVHAHIGQEFAVNDIVIVVCVPPPAHVLTSK